MQLSKLVRYAVCCALCFALSANRAMAEKVELNFYSDFLAEDTMDLQSEIYFQLPGLSFDKYQLDRVEILAGGNGHGKLRVNNNEVDSVRIRTLLKLKKYVLKDADGPSPGKWILQATGTAKIYGATVYFSPLKFSAEDGWRLQPLCSCRTKKRCYVRDGGDGNTEYGPCQFDCPGGCTDD